MNMIPTLSICIPTFNRLHYLREMLETLLPQITENNVEVFVSDNNSTDGTSEYLNKLSNKYSVLRYITQHTNVGLEKNMVEAILAGTGSYILPIGDDEVLPAGSIVKILESIDDVDVLILNGWHTDYKLTPTRIHLPESLQGCSFLRPDEAFISLWDKMPPGSFLASRELFINNNYCRYIGTSHAYTGAIWDALADIEKIRGY